MSSIFLKVCSNIIYFCFYQFVKLSFLSSDGKRQLFWFFVWAFCVGKNQMCLNVCWLSLHGPQRSRLRNVGLSKQFLVHRHRNLLNAQTFLKALSALCFLSQCAC